ncbi:four helix bundle protein [Patescibacteria group bacterium]|nr:four helix bundle protein [Patescibacteria group bacterium]
MEVWKQARKYVGDVYRITSKFPLQEKFGLTSQIRRAAISIVLNIAEGSNRRSDKDFARFLRLSIGSIDELVTALYISMDLNYLKDGDFQKLYKEATILSKRIHALINSIKKL